MKNIITEQERLLLDLKREVKKEVPQIDKDLARKIHKNNLLINKLRRDYLSTLNKICEEIKSKLNQNQLYNLENFKPCLVPPKGNARIGQAPDPEGLTKYIERIRKMSDEEFNLQKEKINP